MKRIVQGAVLTELSPEDCRDTEYQDCDFSACRLAGARFENCAFLDCRFLRCQWSTVTFSFCLMREAVMENCGFRAIAWGGLQGRSALVQPFARLAGCAFQYCDFSGMALNGFDFSSCQFRESVFDDCKLVGASFQSAPLGRTSFTRCDLRKADFRGAESYAIDPAANQLKEARFTFPEVVALLEGTGIRIE